MEDLTPHQNKNQNTTSGVNAVYKIDNRLEQNYIHPTAIIGNNVRLGKGNKIGAYVVIQGKTWIGDNNVFEPFCSIGNEGEHKDFFGKISAKQRFTENSFPEYCEQLLALFLLHLE
jgi:acyl-[acyl carrier protein]--UDP-N-acetylglucosamine O-acyltransferase